MIVISGQSQVFIRKILNIIKWKAWETKDYVYNNQNSDKYRKNKTV